MLQSNTHTSGPGAALTARDLAEHRERVIDMAKLLDVPCTVATCEGRQMAKGLCWKHYSRLRKHGDVQRNDKQAFGIERFWRYVQREDSGCWRWCGRMTPQGYGVFDVADGSSPAHRYAYAVIVEEVPSGFDAHHRCHNRWCVNPSHIEVVEAREHRLEHIRSRVIVKDPAVLLDIKARIAAGVPVARIAREMGYERTVVRQAKAGVYDFLLEEGA